MLTEDRLTVLVEHFYAKVREDPTLGPVFNRAIADWPAHLEKLSAFWSSVMLTSGRYKGNPMMAHLKHRAAIEPAISSDGSIYGARLRRRRSTKRARAQ